MQLTDRVMLERFLARDARFNGRFLTGVVTTGIYCLPSCTAKKPRPENVRFFEHELQALEAGLRPCRRCRPNLFYQRRDPELELFEELIGRIRSRPAEFPDLASVARVAGFQSSRLSELFRRHLHATPLSFLHRVRVERAKLRLLESRASVAEIALEVGFESLSAFHEQFARQVAQAPQAWRSWGRGRTFELALPADYRPEFVLHNLGRDPECPTERVEGAGIEKVVVADGRPELLRVDFAAGRARCRLLGERALSRRAQLEVHTQVLRLLGLASDPGTFERRVRRTSGLAQVVRGRAGLRVPQTASVYEGLLWVIVGQQVTLSFAFTCRRRLIELAGERLDARWRAHPTPAAVARLDYHDLERLQFSRRKAEYLIDLSRSVAAGELDLESLPLGAATRAERTLLACRGLGRWSVNYLMMRSCGFADCVPVGDAGLAKALQRFFALDERPDEDRQAELMRPFAPHRSLATFHLWKSLSDTP